MPAQQRAAALVISVVAGTCVLLSGCGGSSNSSSSSGGLPANSTNRSASGGTMQRVGSTSGTGVKLAGHFCTDFKSVGQNIKVPADAMGSLTALKRHGVPYLERAAAYFGKLAAEAPPQVRKELHVIASDYEAMAASISSGNVGSLARVEQRMVSLTTNGTAGDAFRQLIAYMVTNCVAA